jgi:hypothetical protein
VELKDPGELRACMPVELPYSVVFPYSNQTCTIDVLPRSSRLPFSVACELVIPVAGEVVTAILELETVVKTSWEP